MAYERENKIRKLSIDYLRGIYHDNVKKCIIPAKWALRGLLIWPGNDNRYITMIGWLNFINIVVVNIFHASYVVANRNNISNAILASATVTTNIEALVRFYVVLYKKNTMNNVLYIIWREFWPLACLNNKKIKALTTKCYATVWLTFGCFGPAIFCNAIVSLLPYYSEHDLVFKSVFPFQWNQTYVYEIMYVWHYYSAWYVLFFVNVMDNFIAAVMVIIAIQFIILQNVFKNILTDKSKYHRKFIFGRMISDREMILKCLNQQKILISVCEQMEELLSLPIMVQFFNSVGALCSSCVVLVHIYHCLSDPTSCIQKTVIGVGFGRVDSNQFYTMLTYSVAHMFQLFNYCNVGHELTYQSGNMALAVYNCNWHLSHDMILKKAVILMIQRSQRLQIFKAMGITELNLVSYVTVVRVSFSFYTLLNSLLDRKANIM